jgi:HD-GYP domain-containing protein (c-di-GMP phosphodiesterase class II)
MSTEFLTLDELLKAIREGKSYLLVEPIYDSRLNALVGTEKVLTEKDIYRVQDRCPELKNKKIQVHPAFVHYIDEAKRIQWAAYIVSLAGTHPVLSGLSHQKKEFINKYLKAVLMEDDYLVWKLSQMKNFSKRLFDRSVLASSVALAVYHSYAISALQGMINAQYIHKIIQGAILMDVGLLKYNQQIVETKRAALLPEQGRLMVDHAHDSAQLVLSERSRHQIEDDVIEAIANHEERIDGTGQPAGKTGAELSELSRFLSVVNYFTLMVSGELTVGQKSFRECFIRCKADKPHFDHRFHELLEPTFRHLLTM